jgi:hypothetical protein
VKFPSRFFSVAEGYKIEIFLRMNIYKNEAMLCKGWKCWSIFCRASNGGIRLIETACLKDYILW